MVLVFGIEVTEMWPQTQSRKWGGETEKKTPNDKES